MSISLCRWKWHFSHEISLRWIEWCLELLLLVTTKDTTTKGIFSKTITTRISEILEIRKSFFCDAIDWTQMPLNIIRGIATNRNFDREVFRRRIVIINSLCWKVATKCGPPTVRSIRSRWLQFVVPCRFPQVRSASNIFEQQKNQFIDHFRVDLND